jgi:hypothetical protein
VTEQHVHEWVKAERDWACAECGETSATCGTCHRASGSSLLLCRSCEREAARVLDDTRAALKHYATATSPASLIRSPMAYSLVPQGPSSGAAILSPRDVEAEWWGWVARWTELVGDPSNVDARDYLKAHHMWAAHNPERSDWHAYLHAMRGLRHAARRIAGLLPQRLAEPCVYCGGDVVQDWADERWDPLTGGLSDVVRCTSCGMTWNDRSHWGRATRQHLVEMPAEHPDAWVTLDQARLIFPDVPVRTMRSWARRDREAWESAVGAAQDWWRARCAYQDAETWAAWVAVGWITPGPVPTLPQRQLVELDGRFRVGDLHALAVRRAEEGRPGRPVAERIGA